MSPGSPRPFVTTAIYLSFLGSIFLILSFTFPDIKTLSSDNEETVAIPEGEIRIASSFFKEGETITVRTMVVKGNDWDWTDKRPEKSDIKITLQLLDSNLEPLFPEEPERYTKAVNDKFTFRPYTLPQDDFVVLLLNNHEQPRENKIVEIVWTKSKHVVEPINTILLVPTTLLFSAAIPLWIKKLKILK